MYYRISIQVKYILQKWYQYFQHWIQHGKIIENKKILPCKSTCMIIEYPPENKNYSYLEYYNSIFSYLK